MKDAQQGRTGWSPGDHGEHRLDGDWNYSSNPNHSPNIQNRSANKLTSIYRPSNSALTENPVIEVRMG